MIVGGTMTVVNGLGMLRDRLSDARPGRTTPAKPPPRYASLAVPRRDVCGEANDLTDRSGRRDGQARRVK